MKHHNHRTLSAKMLPAGWFWVHFSDGSGHLESPNGEKMFHYDLLRSDVVEWKKDKNSSWDIFYGAFDEFKTYAEKFISKRIKEENKNGHFNFRKRRFV